MTLDQITPIVQKIVLNKLDLIRLPRLEERLKDDLAADSLDIVVIIMECEKQFKITLPEQGEAALKCVQDIIDLVDACLNTPEESY